MTQLKQKTAVVIGAAGKNNMGQSIAKRLAAEGAAVVVCGRDEKVLQDLASEIDGMAVFCDVTDKASQKNVWRRTLDHYGKCDIAVNCTGWGLMSPILETTEDELDKMMDLQLKGSYFFLQTFGGSMADAGSGSVVQVSSATATAVVESHAAYIATKAGSEALVKCFANELGAQGVKINAIAPGFTRTPMTVEASTTPGLEAAFIPKYPLGRLGTAEDIADAVVWLAQDGSFITGQTLQINGGLTLRGNPTAAEVGASIAGAMAASEN